MSENFRKVLRAGRKVIDVMIATDEGIEKTGKWVKGKKSDLLGPKEAPVEQLPPAVVVPVESDSDASMTQSFLKSATHVRGTVTSVVSDPELRSKIIDGAKGTAGATRVKIAEAVNAVNRPR